MDPTKALHDEIATFVRVVREGTLMGAARELGVPKSTVSRRVSRLEQQLEVKLVHRGGRLIAITEEGRTLFDRVAHAIDAIDLAIKGSQEGMALPRGKVRITAPPDVGQILLVKHLCDFAKLYPDIAIEMEFTNRYVDLVQERFDLAIRAGSGPDRASAQSLISRKLISTRLQLAAMPDVAETIRCIDDLRHTPFVMFRTAGRKQTLRLESTSGRVHQISVEGRFIVHDYASMAALVAEGVGVGLMPNIHVDYPSPNQNLQAILPDLAARRDNILLVYPSRQLPRRVSLFIEHLTRALL